jgi:hypothetical protein
MDFLTLMKRSSANLPPLMSLAALAVIVIHLALFGLARQADEGAAARVFQLLMTAQVPVIAWFAVRWVPRHAKAALQVLALQIAAAVVPLAVLFVLGW